MRISKLLNATPSSNMIMLFVLLALLLRLQGLGWDDWLGFHPDEGNLVRGATELSFPNHLITSFHAYNGLALALPKALAWTVAGGDHDTTTILWASRFLSAVFGTITVWVGAKIAERMAGATAAVIAAAMLCFSEPLLQWSHFGTTESVLALVVLILWLSSIRLIDGDITMRRAGIMWGITLGLALGMKTTAAIFGVIPLIVVALHWRDLDRQAALSAAISVALIAGIFLLTTPAVIFSSAEYFGVMRFESGVVSGETEVFWTRQFFGRIDGLFELRQLWEMLDAGLLILSIGGIVTAIWLHDTKAAPVLFMLLIYCGIVFFWHAKFSRYLAPVIPPLIIFASIFSARLICAQKGKSVAVLTGGALALSLITGFSMAVSFQATDPRIDAANWLNAQVRSGDIVLREPQEVGPAGFGIAETRILPLDDQGLEWGSNIANELAVGQWLIIYSRRSWSVLPRLSQQFPQACGYYKALANGALGYELAASFSRSAPLRKLFFPKLTAEETRVVFDRPEVFIFRRENELSTGEIVSQINYHNADCDVDQIAAELRRIR